MSDLIDDLYIIMRVLMEDGYPSKYVNSIAKAIYTLEQQAQKIKDIERYSNFEDADCYCE